MGLIRLSSATYRAPDLRPARDGQALLPAAELERLRRIWESAIADDPAAVLNSCQRMSVNEVEADGIVADILNPLDVNASPLSASDRSAKMVQSLAYIWDDIHARSAGYGGSPFDVSLSSDRSQVRLRHWPVTS
jgi:hypothetical protein